MGSLGVVGIMTAAVAAAAIALFFLVGPERVWALAGPADLGDVDFATLARRETPNDALACPPGLCRAPSDLTPPAYAMGARALAALFDRAVAAEPALERVGGDDGAPSRRYVQRSRLLRFPDTVVVRFLDLPDGRATLALYSRAQLGRSDFGVNLARIRRWLDRLDRAAAG
ncbi:MAG: DUF1499 domain-containing protein [Alphaproteobacteria bacterium]|nr:DUF1499 domain-containing protein [Alphaproteobacteria bacterium]